MSKLEKKVKKAVDKGAKGGKKQDSPAPEKWAKNAAKRILK